MAKKTKLADFGITPANGDYGDFRDAFDVSKDNVTPVDFKPTMTTGKCAHSHPPLTLPGGYVIHGGSCATPIHQNDDIYIGFDHCMVRTQRDWPWKKGEEFLFLITDGSIPTKVEEFKKLVTWSIKEIKAGKTIHCGCIGGHGRTGIYLAAIVKEMDPTIADPIQYVRDGYCTKAVETAIQVDFLVKEYGAAHKAPRPPRWMMDNKGRRGSYGAAYKGWEDDPDFTPIPKAKKPRKRAAPKDKDGPRLPIRCDPFSSDHAIW